MKTAFFRFYEELNDFLSKTKRKIRFEHNFIDRTSIKDMIEYLGIPHTEVDLILVNCKSVDFSYIVNDRDDISVYPVFESFDISDVQHLRVKPLRNKKFVLDVHLGTLARYLRMTGFDTKYKNDDDDDEIVDVSLNEKRTILTRDKGILKRNEVTHGYFVRNQNPELQLKEVAERFSLKNEIREFERCLECNTRLEKIDKEEIIERLPLKVKQRHNNFWYCRNCDKIYWRGTHFEKMREIINRLLLE
ncbi:MAG: Mut7-C RNAse domain-containing protein [Ignavibacteriaceae bacterium]